MIFLYWRVGIHWDFYFDNRQRNRYRNCNNDINRPLDFHHTEREDIDPILSTEIRILKVLLLLNNEVLNVLKVTFVK